MVKLLPVWPLLPMLYYYACLLFVESEAFLHPVPQQQQQRTNTVAMNNFFQKILGEAFENDVNLSKENGIDGSIDEGNEPTTKRPLTATQQAWRQSMMSPDGVSTLEGSSVELSLFLTGVPNKDPSNDLFGSKTNISSRDRAVGQELPTEPSVQGIRLQFQAESRCAVVSDKSGFCVLDSPGDWRLSDDGRNIRFRVPVSGYTRTVQTKGTIQKVYWSKEDERSTRTQTVYQIPEGWLYGEAEVQKRGTGATIVWSDGVLKVEQSVGLLGVASKMVPCGKFVAGTASAVLPTVESA